MLENVSSRDIILLYAYDLAKEDVNVEPWHIKKLPMGAHIRQVEAREILKKYGRSANPGTVHKILQSDYFRRLGNNIRSPYVPSQKGWDVVKEYLNLVVDGKTIREIWREYNVVNDELKPYSDRKLLVDIVMELVSNVRKEQQEVEEIEDALEIDIVDDESLEHVEDFVDYIVTGIKYRDMGLTAKAYEMFEKALENNELLMLIPQEMSIALAKEGFYREALRMREEYWKRFDESLLKERREIERHISKSAEKSAEKARYAVLEGDISSSARYFEELAEELERSEFSGSDRMSKLAKRYAEELKKLL